MHSLFQIIVEEISIAEINSKKKKNFECKLQDFDMISNIRDLLDILLLVRPDC